MAALDSIITDSGETFLSALPAVGNKETLLKLLIERGAFYDSVNLYGRAERNYSDDADMGMPAPAASPGSAEMALAVDAQESGGGGRHSSTNEQTAGVSEGDIVKTDGRYIYALSGNQLRIVEANGSGLRLVSTITHDNIWGAEFYLMGDKLAVIGHKYTAWSDIMPLPEARAAVSDEPSIDLMWGGGRDSTVLLIYDITDRSNPFESRRVEIDGWNVSSRVIGDVVYLITNKHVWVPFERADSPMIMPCIIDTDTGGELEPISFDRLFYIPGTHDASYLIIGAVDVANGGAVETTAYMGAGSQIYMSRDNLYITRQRWEETGDTDQWGWQQHKVYTDIMRFAVNGNNVHYTGMGTVSGTPINQYSMDEYNGFFRIATTDWQAGTLVTVLNSGMDIIGQTDYMAPGEWMHSMRFMGDMGYVVTFEMVDPLFTIDLADPYNPRVLGELKIPGFSQYLHPVGDGLLLGIGRDTQELFTRDRFGVETVVGFHDVGLKLSLFDVSNPFDPIEADVLHLGEGWADVSHNPRALMCDPSRGLFGFVMDSWSRDWSISGANALIIRVENGRLSIASNLETDGGFYSWGSRLSFIGDTLYLTNDQGIRAYDYNTFIFRASLRF
jgi:uncharacterized secreted protein with C-terminal beta-propeller domain